MHPRASAVPPGDANTPEAFLRRFLREQQMLLLYRQLSLLDPFFSTLSRQEVFSILATNGLHMRGEKSETTSAEARLRGTS
jgi:hypothetical protein